MGETKERGVVIMDLRLIGIGIAVTFAIIALSAITLYVAFRIKETFREEKSTKVQVAKVGFILVIMFMAGGMFYFFATAMSQPEKPSNDTEGYEPIKNDTYEENTSINIFLSYPEQISTDETYTISFILYNPSSETIHDATIKLVGLDTDGIRSNFDINSKILYLGDLFPGEKSGYVQLKAPTKPTTVEGKLILQSDETNQLTRDIKITVLENDKASLPVTNSTPVSPSHNGFPASQMPPVYIIRIEPTANPSSPAVTVAPTPAPAVTVIPTLTPTATATTEPTLNDTTTPAPTPIATATPAPTLNDTPAPTPTATSSPTPTPTDTPTPTPVNTTTPAPVQVDNATSSK